VGTGGQVAVMRHGKAVAPPRARAGANRPGCARASVGGWHPYGGFAGAGRFAARVCSIGATPVTDREREFRRVDGLLLENWLAW